MKLQIHDKAFDVLFPLTNKSIPNYSIYYEVRCGIVAKEGVIISRGTLMDIC